MTNKPKTDKPELKVIQGSHIDPEDVDVTSEELEALAVRLVEDQNLLNEHCPITNNDPVINSLRSGFHIMEDWANAGDRYELPQVVDASVKWYIRRVEDADPIGAYKFISENEANSIALIGEAMFNAHIQDFIHDHPSEMWSKQQVLDAVVNGLGHSADVVRAMFPQQEAEDPTDYRHRIYGVLADAAQAIRAAAQNPVFETTDTVE